MLSPFHHGECFHRLRHRPHDPTFGRTGVVETLGPESGILRQLADCRLGMRQYVHRAQMGRALGEERFTAHEHGYCVVVCRTAWNLALKEKGWKTEEESFPSAGHHADRMGYECSSAESGDQHPRA